MDIFKQKRNLLITIVLLVILNIITLSLLWIGRPKPNNNRPIDGPIGKNGHIQNLLKEELGFSEDQANQFLAIRENHIKNTTQLNEETRRIKKQMFDLTMEETYQPSVSDSLLSLTLEKQKQLEHAMIKHFIDIKNLCNPDQKVKLKKLMHKLFSPPQPKGPGSQKPRRNLEELQPGQMRKGPPPPRN